MEETIVYLKNLLKDNDTVVIGLSGGPDSMCLLNILLSLNKKINIICAHINHNIREESKAELEFVVDYCKQKQVTIETTTFTKKSSLTNYSEQELREKRYQFFEEVINKHNADYLFTAHHGDDLIETILMRLTRGSNLKGYSGFQTETQKENYKVIKPLIYATKDDFYDDFDADDIDDLINSFDTELSGKYIGQSGDSEMRLSANIIADKAIEYSGLSTITEEQRLKLNNIVRSIGSALSSKGASGVVYPLS